MADIFFSAATSMFAATMGNLLSSNLLRTYERTIFTPGVTQQERKNLAMYGYSARRYSYAAAKEIDPNKPLASQIWFMQDADIEDVKFITPPSNCKNCGAPLKSIACEYCNTRFQ